MNKVKSKVRKRAFIFMCSYKTAWDKYLTEEERDGFRYKDLFN